MDTPMDVLHRELKIAGYALARVPGGPEACHADIANKVVRVGDQIPAVYAGIIGLHELGHAFTYHNFSVPNLLCDGMARYSAEFAAWAWAESKIPTGYEMAFNALRAVSLETYERRD